jgi:uncharacterized membrane protein
VPAARLPLVDLLRGGALWAMVVFHLTWDLANFGWIDAEIAYAPGFRWFGHAIAVSFLTLAGVSLVLARRFRGPLGRSGAFWRRWGMIVAAAAAISATSYALFPATPIFFGILHCIALASLLALPFVEAPPVAPLALGVLCLLAPSFGSAPYFDSRILWWTGLSTLTPASNDFRPFAPWAAFVFFGMGLGRLLPLPVLAGRGRGVRGGGFGLHDVGHRDSLSQSASELTPQPFTPALSPQKRGEGAQASSIFARALGFSGRHSLAFYLIHQPLLFGAFTLLSLVVTPQSDEKAFLRSCAVKCINQGVGAALCENACACVITRAQKQGFWLEMARDRLTPQQKSEAHDIAVACYADADKP